MAAVLGLRHAGRCDFSLTLLLLVSSGDEAPLRQVGFRQIASRHVSVPAVHQTSELAGCVALAGTQLVSNALAADRLGDLHLEVADLLSPIEGVERVSCEPAGANACRERANDQAHPLRRQVHCAVAESDLAVASESDVDAVNRQAGVRYSESTKLPGPCLDGFVSCCSLGLEFGDSSGDGSEPVVQCVHRDLVVRREVLDRLRQLLVA